MNITIIQKSQRNRLDYLGISKFAFYQKLYYDQRTGPQILKHKKQIFNATLQSQKAGKQTQFQIDPNQQRKIINLHCPLFDECSGCTVRSDLTRPPIYDEANQFFNQYNVKNFDLIYGELKQWRFRAKLAVRGNPKNPKIGLFRAGTHFVVDMEEGCQMHHPLINDGIKIIRELIIKHKIQPYHESSLKGQLRYLQLTVVKNSNQNQTKQGVELVLVLNMQSDEFNRCIEVQTFIDKLWKFRKDFFCNIWVNFQNENKNSIFGKDWKLIKGRQYSIQNYNGVDVQFHAGSFQQSNLEMMNRAIDFICMHVPEGSAVLEMHAGAGVIGLCVASRRSPKRVTFVENNDSNQQAFQRSKKSIELDVLLEYVVQDVNIEADKLIRGQNVVIVDPPRKGLQEGLMEVLTGKEFADDRKELKSLIYLSCGFPSLKRNLMQLIDSGCWEMEACESFLFFPGTNSLESLVVLNYINQ